MTRIADHIVNAEPVEEGSHFYKTLRSDKRISTIQVFPFALSAEQYPFFEQQVSLLNEAVVDYRAAIPRILSWGFTKTGNFPFVEMEWTEGYDLTQLNNQQESVTIDEIGKIAEQVSRVLTYCHNLEVVHGNISSKHILWDKKREEYILTGFQLGLQPSKPITPAEKSSSRSKALLQQPAASSQQKDINDLGLVLFQLLKNNLLADPSIELADLSGPSSVAVKLKDGTLLPAWLATCITKALSKTSEEKFKSASQMYHYIILHHKTPLQKRQWYRSKPQQPLTAQPKPPLKAMSIAPKKLRSLWASGVQSGRNQMRFVFDRRIAVGLIIAGLLAGFSIVAQKREKEAKEDLSETSPVILPPQQDTAAYITKENTSQNNPQSIAEEKKKTATPKIIADNKIASARKTPVVKPIIEEKVNNNADLGSYKVRSRAYFHNQPDETTRRNAFIVHWNNAILHPLKEENDFVYVVFTNDEGQTSRGWLRKKDLIKL